MTGPMTLGEKIAALRKQSGMSQDDLASKIVITRQAVSRWERGESVPDVENIVQLSEIFGVTTDYLLKDGVSTAVKVDFSRHDDNYEKEGKPDHAQRPYWYRKFFNNGLVYVLAALIYFIAGMTRGLWHPGWVVFGVAWIIEEVINFARTGRFHISIYGITAIIFVVVVLFFREIRHAWLIFVVAWVIDEMVVRKKPKKKKKSDLNNHFDN